MPIGIIVQGLKYNIFRTKLYVHIWKWATFKLENECGLIWIEIHTGRVNSCQLLKNSRMEQNNKILTLRKFFTQFIFKCENFPIYGNYG